MVWLNSLTSVCKVGWEAKRSSTGVQAVTDHQWTKSAASREGEQVWTLPNTKWAAVFGPHRRVTTAFVYP